MNEGSSLDHIRKSFNSQDMSKLSNFHKFIRRSRRERSKRSREESKCKAERIRTPRIRAHIESGSRKKLMSRKNLCRQSLLFFAFLSLFKLLILSKFQIYKGIPTRPSAARVVAKPLRPSC
jgi:hypothetical protein